VIVLMGIGLELSQALSNILVSPIPPYRIDIHDVLIRALGVLIMYALFSLSAALYRWKVPARGQRYGLAGFVDALIRRI
jgi:glycopeptide antibiotics resistance protein